MAFFATMSGQALLTFLISMVPVIELRLGIPYGIAQGLDPWVAFGLSVAGNLLPVPFILLFIHRIVEWMKTRKHLSWFADKLENRANKRSGRVKKSEVIGLCLLVAIPLPGTGAWTGALVAGLMDMRIKRAFPTIMVGVVIAGLFMTLAATGVKALSFLA